MQLLHNGLDVLTRHASCRPDDLLLFVASFDGALADYQNDPTRAEITPARLALLTRLHRLPSVVVAVISGRPLDDLRPRIPLDDEAYYIGLHGLEIAGPQFRQACGEEIRRYADCMSDVAVRLRDLLGDVPGVRVECKGPIVALHTREAAPAHVVWSRFQLLSAAADLVNTEWVRPLRGRDVLELVPNVGRSRAEALSTVRRCVEERSQRTVFTMYLGEDVADDGALNAVGDRGVAAVIGRRTHTAYHLESSEDVDVLLDELIAGRLRRTHANG
jgi:trehalose-phosphatase